jgi:hypothetical protein
MRARTAVAVTEAGTRVRGFAKDSGKVDDAATKLQAKIGMQTHGDELLPAEFAAALGQWINGLRLLWGERRFVGRTVLTGLLFGGLSSLMSAGDQN